MAVLAEGGLAGLTSARLAEQAQVSKGTLFHHFPSLDDVPHAVLDHILEGLSAASQHHDTPRGFLHQSGSDVLDLTARRADAALAMQALFAGATPGSRLAARLADLSIAGREQMAQQLLALSPDTPPDRARTVADLTVCAVDGLAMHLSLTGEAGRLDRAWELLVEVLLATLHEPSQPPEAVP